MSAFFFNKQTSFRFGKTLLFLFIVAILCYAQYLSGAQSVAVSKNFYFLVLETTHIQASTHQSQLLGGAGFLLREQKQDYVALSVYLQDETSVLALETAEKSIENVKIITLQSGNLHFKSVFSKQRADFYVGAFNTLYSLIEVLNREISRLDNGATQESSKRLLRVYQKQFSYLKKQYQDVFSAFSSVCENAAKELFKMIDNVVYTKDLRYLLCELCVAYTQLSAVFSL